MAMLGYTTRGSVRLGCGHTHKTLAKAEVCRLNDMRACRAVGGYSDRIVIRANGDPLSAFEIDRLEYNRRTMPMVG
jgi:hypothetical protein